jgi:hypothetical protein
LEVAVPLGSPRAYLLEKDIWVVEVLDALFSASFGRELVFKGGTSLAKAYAVVRRFSEDVDITRDIRAIAPDLVSGAGADALPPTRSQERRWTRMIRERLAAWVREQAVPEITEQLARADLNVRVRAERDNLHVAYEPLFDRYGFVQPEILVEFGARSTGEPAENDAAGNRIDYEAAVSGELQLTPDGPARAALADDYNKMLADGMLLDDEAPFEVIMTRCAEIESRANRLEPDARNPSGPNRR